MRRRNPEDAKTEQRSRLLRGRIPLVSLLQTLAVAEHLSFRHAANVLGIAQSCVSRRIKDLEEELGIPLFERSTRGVRLTEAGRRFVDEIMAGIDQLDHAVKSAGMVASGKCGRLRIGVHALIPSSFLDNLLIRYRQKNPGITVEMVEGSARDTILQLRTERLDVVFVVGAPELPDCHSRPIWTEPLMAALPASHPLAGQPGITWADLVEQTFLVRHGGTGPQVFNHIIQQLSSRWPAPTILRFEVERSTLLSMVRQGFGITLVGAANSLSPTSGVVFVRSLTSPSLWCFRRCGRPTITVRRSKICSLSPTA